MTTTVFVSIGRNAANGTPAPQNIWDRFQSDVRAVLTANSVTVLAQYHGTGVWEGQTEDSYAVLVLVPDPSTVNYLRHRFASLADYYGQDAIGFLVHDHATYPESYTEA